MNKVLLTERIPIKIWTDNIEKGALEQAKNLANLPFSFKHIALMPDVHQGYGMPIGGVMATERVIIPNAVGVDIGCGMDAVKTSLIDIDKEVLKKIIGEIRKVIPVGFKHHKEDQDWRLMPKDEDYDLNKGSIVYQEWDSAIRQIGTLGGGNHFIEIQKGSDGYIWIMVHSGSRNIGYKVAKYYNEIAKKINEKWYTVVPPSWQLAFLPMNSDEGKTYLEEMKYCVDFAFANRKLMLDRIIKVFKDTFPNDNIKFDKEINIAHNYASLENHFNRNVWIHRKGATKAYEGTIGIIPGSQGSNSYIVIGKGNEQSFKSCSHGAGRVMGRKEAKRVLNLQEEKQRLDEKGIIHSIRNKDDLDEATSAYKDIAEVIKNQADLVDVLVELRPLGVVKG